MTRVEDLIEEMQDVKKEYETLTIDQVLKIFEIDALRLLRKQILKAGYK